MRYASALSAASWKLALGAYCMLLIGLIFFELSQRESVLEHIAKTTDSPVNLVFQLDREFLRLTAAINDVIQSTTEDKENLQLRSDIFYSRIDLVRHSIATQTIISREHVHLLLDRLSDIHASVEASMTKSALDRDLLRSALSRMNELESSVQALSFEASSRMIEKIESEHLSVIRHINLIIFMSVAQMVILSAGFALFVKRQIQLQELNSLLELRVQERSAAKAEAETANRSKSRYLSAVSHDLRQPTAALALYAGILTADLKTGNKSVLSNMQSCIDDISNLIEHLMQASQLESGVVTVDACDFTLEELCASIQANHGLSATKKGIQLRCRHTNNIVLHTDKQLFKRILGNLIDNALKFTTHGGVLIAARRRGGRMWIEVWDTGPGIPQDDMAHIFEEFHRLEDTKNIRGCGLGLAIAAKISTLLGLKIRVRSQLGHGSMFAIELPEASEAAEHATLETLDTRPVTGV